MKKDEKGKIFKPYFTTQRQQQSFSLMTSDLSCLSILFLYFHVFYLGQFVQENLLNQSISFEDVAVNMDTNKSQNLKLLLDVTDFHFCTHDVPKYTCVHQQVL